MLDSKILTELGLFKKRQEPVFGIGHAAGAQACKPPPVTQAAAIGSRRFAMPALRLDQGQNAFAQLLRLTLRFDIGKAQ